MMKKWIITVFLVCTASFFDVNAQKQTEKSLGELLYTTHCLVCHSTEVHWREKKTAKNWTTLKDAVVQWQRTSGLIWSEDDVTAVARYLNDQYYHFSVSDIADANSSKTNVSK